MSIKVRNIGGYVVNNYLLKTPHCVLAIDTGYPGGEGRFIRRFERLWPLSELKYIFLTHHHDDHAGFLGDLMNNTRTKVVLHPKAIRLLETGQSGEPPGAGYSSRLASLFSKVKKDFFFPPVTVGGRAVPVQDESDQFFLADGS